MNKEIKEILKYLEECIGKEDEFKIDNDMATKLGFYITNLQQENKQLKQKNKEIYDGFMVAIDEVCETDREKRKYKERIDKAIEYIKQVYERNENGKDYIWILDFGEIEQILLGDKE